MFLLLCFSCLFCFDCQYQCKRWTEVSPPKLPIGVAWTLNHIHCYIHFRCNLPTSDAAVFDFSLKRPRSSNTAWFSPSEPPAPHNHPLVITIIITAAAAAAAAEGLLSSTEQPAVAGGGLVPITGTPDVIDNRPGSTNLRRFGSIL